MRVEAFAEDETRCDAFLGGRIALHQPLRGYRAGIDPVLLAAACPVSPGARVLELGCGAGAALCCLAARVPGVALSGLELQPGYAALARRNLAQNGFAGRIWVGDIAEPPADLRQEGFDAVIANPPYFRTEAQSPAADGGRSHGRASETPLALWVSTAARRLGPRGIAVFIQRIERLPELLAAAHERLGALEVLPLAARTGRAPRLVLLRGRKGARGAFRLHPAKALHAGARHLRDGDDYTAEIDGVLRDAAPLAFAP